MLYGYTQNPRILVIAAADHYDEMLALSNNLGDLPGSRQTTFIDHLKAEFKDYKKPAFIIPFGNEVQLKQWCEGQVELTSAQRCIELHRQMVEDLIEDPHANRTSLEEVFGLAENDPWDTRTEEEKEAAKKVATSNKKLTDQISKNLSGSSFGPKATSSAGPNINQPKSTISIDRMDQVTDNQIAVAVTKTQAKQQKTVETIAQLVELAKESGVEIDPFHDIYSFAADTELSKISDEDFEKIRDLIRDIQIAYSAKQIAKEFDGTQYSYMWNQLLSDNPAVGGPYPIFETKSNNTEHSVSVLSEILPALDSRFAVVSGGIFVFHGSKDEGDVILKSHGLSEIFQIDHVWKNRNLLPDNIELTPRDFARALAGDGKSTVAATGSWGREKVAKSLDEYDVEHAIEINLDTLVTTIVTKDQISASHKVSLEKVNSNIHSAEINVPRKNILLTSESKITVISTDEVESHRAIEGKIAIIGAKDGGSVMVHANSKLLVINIKHITI